MKAALRLVLISGISLAGIVYGAGCVVRPHGEIDVVDDQGNRHHGYYDDDHHWHGGWDDANHVHHDDPDDWHH